MWGGGGGGGLSLIEHMGSDLINAIFPPDNSEAAFDIEHWSLKYMF